MKEGEILDKEMEGVLHPLVTIMELMAIMLIVPSVMQLLGPKFIVGKNFSIDVGPKSVLVLPANPRRGYASFVNDSLEVIYLSLGEEAVIGQGVRLNPEGGWYEITQTNLYQGDIYAICPGAGKLSVIEGY